MVDLIIADDVIKGYAGTRYHWPTLYDLLDISSHEEEGKILMDKKHWKTSLSATTFVSYEEAEAYAKRKAKDFEQIVIYESVALVKAPVPAAEVTKL